MSDKRDTNHRSSTKNIDSSTLPTTTNTDSSKVPFIINLELQDIEGIGSTTAKKLKEIDVLSPMDLAVTSADDLATETNISKVSATSFILAAQKLLRDSRIIEKEFVTAGEVLEKRKLMRRCSTG